MSALQRLCADKGLAFRIETSNDRLIDALDREARDFDWIVGLACPYEIQRLSPRLWEQYGLRQLILPLGGMACASHANFNQAEAPPAKTAAWELEPLLEVLRVFPAPPC